MYRTEYAVTTAKYMAEGVLLIIWDTQLIWGFEASLPVQMADRGGARINAMGCHQLCQVCIGAP